MLCALGQVVDPSSSSRGRAAGRVGQAPAPVHSRWPLSVRGGPCAFAVAPVRACLRLHVRGGGGAGVTAPARRGGRGVQASQAAGAPQSGAPKGRCNVMPFRCSRVTSSKLQKMLLVMGLGGASVFQIMGTTPFSTCLPVIQAVLAVTQSSPRPPGALSDLALLVLSAQIWSGEVSSDPAGGPDHTWLCNFPTERLGRALSRF